MKKLQNIRHFIWDFDGTLFDTYPVVIQNIQDALEEFGYTATSLDLMDKLLETVDHTLTFYAQQLHLDKNALYEAYQRHQTASNKQLKALPMDAVEQALQTIKCKGCYNYIFTHMPLSSTLAFLDKYDLTKYFTDFVAPETQGFARKPAPDAILYLINKYALSKDNTVMIGDRALDLISGKNAGIRTIHYLCKSIPQNLDCDWRFDNFKDFTKALTPDPPCQKTDETQ